MRVNGYGPKPAEVMLIGEAPGRDEDRTGMPFVGKSGQELTRWLKDAGLDREQMYITNICKTWPPVVNGKQTAPTKEMIAADEPELLAEIAAVKPKWIGAVGRVATQWLLGKHVDMEWSHGMAFPVPMFGAKTFVIALYHPAAALHNPELAPLVWWDIQRLSDYVHGKLQPVATVDEYPQPKYVRHGDEKFNFQTWSQAVGWYDNQSMWEPLPVLAVDTEGLPGSPWGMSLTATPGKAIVVPEATVHKWQSSFDGAQRIVMHNALHDVPILDEMGISVDWSKVEDTMLMLYCLRLHPLGLKPVSKRLSGMDMQSYTDVIAPADRKLALDWVQKAIVAKQCPLCDGAGKVPVLAKNGLRLKKTPERCPGVPQLGLQCIDGGLWPDRDEQLQYDWDTGKWRITKGWSVQRYLRRLEEDLQTGKLDTPDPETGEMPSVRQRVQNWPDDVQQIVSAEIGELKEASLNDIPQDAATRYSARDADATLRNYPKILSELQAMDLEKAYRLDLSVMPVADRMQRTGMHVDLPYFSKFGQRLQYEKQILLAQLDFAVGRPINPSSGDQVAGLLFGESGLSFSDRDAAELIPLSFDLDSEKSTKGGKRAAVDDKVLEGLKLKYAGNKKLVQVIDLILEYRIRDKINGTYVEKIPRIARLHNGLGWRVHTKIKAARTATFRWASADPNLQNIPARPKGQTDLGKLVRTGFTATPGYVMGSWDFDQIEMRVLAWYSQDANLLRIFREGLDIHSMTAALVFKIPFEQFMLELNGLDKQLAKKRKDQRTSAKNIGFGVVYGVTARGLQAQMELRGLNWTAEECQSLIDLYLFSAYPGVGAFMMDAHAEARRNGYVRSLMGHIRYCPNVHSSISSVREEALRQAANFKIQCSAAELLKEAMRLLWYEAGETLAEMDVRWLMAVHDELLLECPDVPHVRAAVDNIVTAYMTNPVELKGVHIGTSGKFDYNWGALK